MGHGSTNSLVNGAILQNLNACPDYLINKVAIKTSKATLNKKCHSHVTNAPKGIGQA